VGQNAKDKPRNPKFLKASWYLALMWSWPFVAGKLPATSNGDVRPSIEIAFAEADSDLIR